jgi:hypothetical protein
MSRIFLSHASEDNETAAAVHCWLTERGWGPVFLDFHPTDGLKPGQRWEEALAEAANRCIAVILLISRDWLGKPECLTEFKYTRYTKFREPKFIIPVLINECQISELPPDLAQFQAVRLSDLPSDFTSLEKQLHHTGLDPDQFEFNPSRIPEYAPYRGLAALGESDAAVFFGRDAEIARCMRLIQQARASIESSKIIQITGASGSGKSSLLRAGVLSRLGRRQEMVVIPAISVLPAAISQSASDRGMRIGLVSALNRALCQANEPGLSVAELASGEYGPFGDALDRLAQQARNRGVIDPLIVLPIDQCEEVLQGGPEGEVLGALLDEALHQRRDFLLLTAIRSDKYFSVQEKAPFRRRESMLLQLSPVSALTLSDIVYGPARLATQSPLVEPDLAPAIADALGGDLESIGEALPLIALTLARLYEHSVAKGVPMSSRTLENIGGVTGVVNWILAQACIKHNLTEKELLDVLIPAFVSLGADGEVTRKVVHYGAATQTQHPALEALVDFRLVSLSTDAGGQTTAEVMHEAVFTAWKAASLAIYARRDHLIRLHQLEVLAELKGANTGASVAMALSDIDLRQYQSLRKHAEYGAHMSPRAIAFLNDNKKAFQLRRLWQSVAAGAALLTSVGLVAAATTESTRAWALGVAQATPIPEATFALAALPPRGALLWSRDEARPCAIGVPATPPECLLRLSGGVEPIVGRWPAHESVLEGAAYDPQTQTLLTWDRVGSLVLREFGPIPIEPHLLMTDATIETASALSAPAMFAVGNSNGEIGLIRGHTLLQTVQVSASPISATRGLQGGALFVGDQAGGLFRLEPRLGFQALQTAGSHRRAVLGIVPTADERWVISMGADGVANVVDSNSGSLAGSFIPNQGQPVIGGDVGRTASGPFLLSIPRRGAATVLLIPSGQLVRRLERHRGPITAWDVQDAEIATGDATGAIWIWSPDEGRDPIGPLNHLSGSAIVSLIFSIDGKTLLSAGSDGTARVWDVETGIERTRLSSRGGALLGAWLMQGDEGTVSLIENGETLQHALVDFGQSRGGSLRERVCGNALNRDTYVRLLDQDAPWSAAIFLPPDPCRWRGLFNWG